MEFSKQTLEKILARVASVAKAYECSSDYENPSRSNGYEPYGLESALAFEHIPWGVVLRTDTPPESMPGLVGCIDAGLTDGRIASNTYGLRYVAVAVHEQGHLPDEKQNRERTARILFLRYGQVDDLHAQYLQNVFRFA